MQAILHLQAKGTRKLDEVYNRNHIALLVKALVNKHKTIQEEEKQQLSGDQVSRKEAKLDVL